MERNYPVKLIAFTEDPFASIKAARLGSPEEIDLYDSRLYRLYVIEGSSVSRKGNGMHRLHPNSKEYKAVMKEATNF